MIHREAVMHTPRSSDCYPFAERGLCIRLRTAKGNVEKVQVLIGSFYGWEQRETFDMDKVASDKLFDYYEYRYDCRADIRLAYCFRLIDKEEELLYGENGFFVESETDVDHDRTDFLFFKYSTINPVDIHRRPSWVGGATFYQIFVERFANGDDSLSPDNVQPWGTPPTRSNFMGGDLPGIIQHLDYLQELGVTALYLTPIFEGGSNHKYDTVDYGRIDPHFGDEDTLRELVQKAHEHGIRVVLDAVFNHCSFHFPPFQDVLKNGENSPYKTWFRAKEFPLTIVPQNYEGFAIGPYMPKLNLADEGMRQHILKNVEKWTRCGIDGWRLDVADAVDCVFWRDFRRLVRSINPEAVIIGECWWNSADWLRGDMWDGVMNYPVERPSELYFAKGAISAEEFTNRVNQVRMRYTRMANECMLNLLDSHDAPRFINLCGGDKRRLKNAAAFLFTYIGMPCTYYGTEIGMTGENDPDDRKCFDWNRDNWDMDLWEHYHKLMVLRRDDTIVQYGDVRLWAENDLVILRRFAAYGLSVITVINNTEEEHSCELSNIGGMTDLFTGDKFALENGKLHVTVPPMTARVLTTDSLF